MPAPFDRGRAGSEMPRDFSVETALERGADDLISVGAEFEEPGPHQVLAYQADFSVLAGSPGDSHVQPGVAGRSAILDPGTPVEGLVPLDAAWQIQERPKLETGFWNAVGELRHVGIPRVGIQAGGRAHQRIGRADAPPGGRAPIQRQLPRSEEHMSELQ